MNIDALQGQWKVLKGTLRERWGRLTDNDVTQLEGHSEKLVGKIQELYGLDQAAAEKEVEIWFLEQQEPAPRSKS